MKVFLHLLLWIALFLLKMTTLSATNAWNDVTLREYTQFLNAVAKEDPHLLYDQKMGAESGMGLIERVGEPGNYSYYFREEEGDASVLLVDLRSAMRFCNWKENGEQENPATTEYGVYEMGEDKLLSVHIDETTTYFLPRENDGIASQDHSCLKLRSLEDPASWQRSNQVVFHLKGRLENIATFLKQETPKLDNSWLEDAGYVIGAIATMTAVAATWKYRDSCYTPRAGYEQLTDGEAEEPARMRAGSEPLGNNFLGSISPSISTSSAAAAAVKESKEQRFQREAQEFINKNISPRTQMIERAILVTPESPYQLRLADPFESQVAQVRKKGEKFIQFFKSNFEKAFDYTKRTASLAQSMEFYMNDLVKRIQIPQDSRFIKLITGDPSLETHKDTMSDAQRYCREFDRAWEDVFKVTEVQRRVFEALQRKDNWISNYFSNLVNEKKMKIEMTLNGSWVGQVKNLRTGAVKKFFEKTFGEQFKNDHKSITSLIKDAQDKIGRWNQQVEDLPFVDGQWSPEGLDQRKEDAQDKFDQEIELLCKHYKEWSDQAEHAITRGERFYDAVNHQIPNWSDKCGLTEKEHGLMVSTIQKFNNQKNLSLEYPSKNEEEKYLKEWVGDQYNKIKQELKDGRGLFQTAIHIVTSPEKVLAGDLPENEKKVLRYFLGILDRSPVEFVREKATELRQELDPTASNSEDGDFEADSSEDGDSDLPF